MPPSPTTLIRLLSASPHTISVGFAFMLSPFQFGVRRSPPLWIFLAHTESGEKKKSKAAGTAALQIQIRPTRSTLNFVPAVPVAFSASAAGGEPAGVAIDLDVYLFQPLPRHEAVPLDVALDDLLPLQSKAIAVEGQFQVELGRLALDVADDHVDPVPVALVVAVGGGGVGGHVAVAVDVADEQVPGRQQRHRVADVLRRPGSPPRLPDARLLLRDTQLVALAFEVPQQEHHRLGLVKPVDPVEEADNALQGRGLDAGVAQDAARLVGGEGPDRSARRHVAGEEGAVAAEEGARAR